MAEEQAQVGKTLLNIANIKTKYNDIDNKAAVVSSKVFARQEEKVSKVLGTNTDTAIKFTSDDIIASLPYMSSSTLAMLSLAADNSDNVRLATAIDETMSTKSKRFVDAYTTKIEAARKITDETASAELVNAARDEVQNYIQSSKLQQAELQVADEEADQGLAYLSSVGVNLEGYHQSAENDEEVENFKQNFVASFQSVYETASDEQKAKMDEAQAQIVYDEYLREKLLNSTNKSENNTDFGIGDGAGTGVGNGTGAGENGEEGGNINYGTTTVPDASSDKNPTISKTIAEKAKQSTVEISNAAAYANAISNEPQINHIFSNPFYNARAVPHWAFSVDFIPTADFNKAITSQTLIELSKIMTKAIMTVNLPSRDVQSTVSHYKGMTIELPSRAKTSGELPMKFAETETCTILRCLDMLLEFARNSDYYEFDTETADRYFSNLQSNASMSVEQIQQAVEAMQSYRDYIPNNGHQFNILVKLYKAFDTKIFNDSDTDELPSFVYFFKGCDLKTINQIDFDYEADSPVDVSCVFTYQFFEEMTYYEYALRYASMPAENQATRELADNAASEAAEAAQAAAQIAHAQATAPVYQDMHYRH